MPEKSPTSTLGELLDLALLDAKQRWIEEHANGHDREVWYVSNFKRVQLETEIPASGRQLLFVTVHGKEPWQASTYGYALHKLGGGKYLPYPRRKV